MNTTVGIFTTHADAEFALHELRAFNVREEDISYVYVNVQGDLVDDQTGKKVDHAAATGITTGVMLGAALGFVVAEGVLPGIGPLLVAGPLAAALGITGVTATTIAGAMTGGVAGGFLGALAGLGVSADDAARFQEYLRVGNVLVIVRSATLGVHDVFMRAHAKEVREYWIS